MLSHRSQTRPLSSAPASYRQYTSPHSLLDWKPFWTRYHLLTLNCSLKNDPPLYALLLRLQRFRIFVFQDVRLAALCG